MTAETFLIALSSMAELCCLEISSRTSQSRESWSVILKVCECGCCANMAQLVLQGGKSLYSGPSIRWRRETPGSVVCVRDAFFSASQAIHGISSSDGRTQLPIRRQSHPSTAKTIDGIKQEVEAYALMFPNVAFTLQDDSKSRDNASSKGHVLRVPKVRKSFETDDMSSHG